MQCISTKYNSIGMLATLWKLYPLRNYQQVGYLNDVYEYLYRHDLNMSRSITYSTFIIYQIYNMIQ